eukprot:Opistho-2@64144
MASSTPNEVEKESTDMDNVFDIRLAEEASACQFQSELQDMLYAMGVPKEPSEDVTIFLEEYVLDELITLIGSVIEATAERGGRSITTEDVLYQLRKDATITKRVLDYLRWREVRKRVAKEAVDEEEDEEEADLGVSSESTLDATGGSSVAGKQGVRASWSLLDDVYAAAGMDAGEWAADSDATAAEEMKRRMKRADVRTREMTHDEYMLYSERRKVCFANKRNRNKFRTWLCIRYPVTCHDSTIDPAVTDQLLEFTEETLDILAIVAYEKVARMTEASLLVKEERDLLVSNSESGRTQIPSAVTESSPGRRQSLVDTDASFWQRQSSRGSGGLARPQAAPQSQSATLRSSPSSLFGAHSHARTSITRDHICEALRRLRRERRPMRVLERVRPRNAALGSLLL